MVAPLQTKLSDTALAEADILVIVEAVRRWVNDGGSLLLVADHMPFPGAAHDLARAHGFDFVNNFAIDTVTWDPIVFRRSDGSLSGHPITEGIDSIATFTGQAFRAGDSTITPLLTFGSGIITYEPTVAWEFDRVQASSAAGMLQGAVRSFGAGRVVVLGVAAMLTAQVAGPNRRPMGMNAPVAGQNQQFVLNLLHWLSGAL